MPSAPSFCWLYCGSDLNASASRAHRLVPKSPSVRPLLPLRKRLSLPRNDKVIANSRRRLERPPFLFDGWDMGLPLILFFILPALLVLVFMLQDATTLTGWAALFEHPQFAKALAL